MLLIFDLDDTLIETTTLLTAAKLKVALVKMIEGGLAVQDPAFAEKMLLRMNLGAKSTKELLSEFVELFKGNQTHVDIGMEEIESVDVERYAIEPAHLSIDVLESLRHDHLLALVTRGKEAMQRAKLRLFGIDPSLFFEIVITPRFDKGVHYERLAKSQGISPQEVMVIGDRIEIDLLDAKKLGMITVHMKKGRGATNESMREIVDHTIYEMTELPAILELTDKPLEMV